MANINAQLLGVVIADDASTATIKFGGSKRVVHFIGDKIEGQTKIIDIQGYRIVVLQGGVNKQMVMKKPDTIIEQSKGVSKSPQVFRWRFCLCQHVWCSSSNGCWYYWIQAK